MTVEISAIFGRGVLASRPAAGTAGTHYFATDTGLMYRDNGATWDAENPITIATNILVTGFITPTQLAANTDNWNPTSLSTAAVIRVSTDASRNLTGLAGGVEGRVIVLRNVGAFSLVLKHNVTSTAGNRFYCPGAADYTLTTLSSVLLMYDGTSSRWYVL